MVIAGYQKKNKILSDHERLIVSYHEIGHALVAALQSGTAPVAKITIIPRTSGALGYTMQVEQEERHTFSPAKMWINGLTMLNKPLLQFHTQFNAALPWDLSLIHIFLA